MMNPTQVVPAVGMIVFNEAGEVLMQKRKDVGEWCILSGHVEFGETVEDAAIREIWEETGCRARIVRLIGIYSEPRSQTYHYGHKTIHYITSYFEAKLVEPSTSIVINEESHEISFFPLHHLPKPLAQMHPNWLNDALDKNVSSFVR